MLKTCPVCAAPGEDLAFTFECTNPDCQNFVLGRQTSAQPETDLDPDDFYPGWMFGESSD
jgi:hypothetical protein